MSNNQEYQNIAEEYFWNRINTILDGYFTNNDYIYVYHSSAFSNCSSFYIMISSRTNKKFTSEHINFLNNSINNINTRIKEVYNSNESRVKFGFESAEDNLIKVHCSVETNENDLHDYLVEIFMPALSVFLCNYARDNDSGEIIMLNDIRIKIFFKCMSLLNDLIENRRFSPTLAMKLTDILRYILFSKSLKEISNNLVLKHVDIDCSKKPKPELTLQPENSEDTNHSPQ